MDWKVFPFFFVSKVGINDVSFPNEVFDGGGRMKALLSQQITDFLTFFKGLLIAKNIYYACWLCKMTFEDLQVI